MIRTIHLLTTLCTAVATFATATPAPPRATDRPNIILFLADDVGIETLQAYGGSSWKTPHLDRLARDGMRLDSCLATPMCATSRAMLLTGRHNFRNYRKWASIDPSATTVASELRKAGYATAMAGKWHLGCWEPDPSGKRGPARLGFDEYLSCRIDEESVKSRHAPGRGNPYWKTRLIHNNREQAALESQHSEQAFLDFSIDFLRKHRDRPFFLHHASLLAHRPFVRVASPAPEDFNQNGKLRHFGPMLTRLDEVVGALRAELERLGIANNTLFIFTSDNGTDRVAEASGLRSTWRGQAVRGGKYLVNELGTTVPCLVAWPGRIPPSSSSRAPADFTDFLPTLLEAAGAAPSPQRDGSSLVGILTGTTITRPKPAFTWGSLDGTNEVYPDPPGHRDAILHAARDERWRYLSDGRIFDIVADPRMREAVAPGASPEADAARSRLKTALDTLRASQPALW